MAAVSPSSGAPDGGDPVTILGANFAGGAAVFFGTQPATGVLVESELTIRAVTPPGTVGAVDVKVINPDERTGTLPQGFRYVTDVTAPVFTTPPWVAGWTLTGTPGAETATAEIRWQTDEPATSVVDYRRAGDPTYQRLEDLALVEDHVLVLTDLETATTYELVVTSADRHGNPASTATTFTTLIAPDVTPPVITSGPMITAL